MHGKRMPGVAFVDERLSSRARGSLLFVRIARDGGEHRPFDPPGGTEVMGLDGRSRASDEGFASRLRC